MFKKADPSEINFNIFNEFGKNWMLVSAKKPDGTVNTMTVSWGAMGMLWGKNAATIYIRQSRFTKEFIDSSDYFTVSLFDGHKKELGILGSKSGRNGDKVAEVGFTPVTVEDQPAFDESKCVCICRKMYRTDIPLDSMPSDVVDRWYSDGDYHTMYIGEIVSCYVNE